MTTVSRTARFCCSLVAVSEKNTKHFTVFISLFTPKKCRFDGLWAHWWWFCSVDSNTSVSLRRRRSRRRKEQID